MNLKCKKKINFHVAKKPEEVFYFSGQLRFKISGFYLQELSLISMTKSIVLFEMQINENYKKFK